MSSHTYRLNWQSLRPYLASQHGDLPDSALVERLIQQLYTVGVSEYRVIVGQGGGTDSPVHLVEFEIESHHDLTHLLPTPPPRSVG